MAPCSYVPSLQNQSKCVKDNNIIVKKNSNMHCQLWI